MANKKKRLQRCLKCCGGSPIGYLRKRRRRLERRRFLLSCFCSGFIIIIIIWILLNETPPAQQRHPELMMEFMYLRVTRVWKLCNPV